MSDRVGRWRYPALAFFTGSAVTIFEFSAPNLLRANFGQTIYVWANVIGVILGALAVGYTLGGRWADRTESAKPLFWVLAFAGLYGLFVGAAGPGIARWIAGPDEYEQDAALGAFIVQSLAASLMLFGPPLIALGMATPLMVTRAAKNWPVGRAAGLIFGVGTLGSLAGIYLTTFVLLDRIGTRATILFAAGSLVVVAAIGLWRVGPRRAALVILPALLTIPFAHHATWDKLPGGKLVYFAESPYQLVRVIDVEENGNVSRWLAFDEGMGTYHSMQLQKDSHWTGAYYDAFATIPEWVGREKMKICIVGNAAGTMSELLQIHHSPDDLEIDGVEIDPAVTRAAQEAMGLNLEEQPALRVFHEDGRRFLMRQPAGKYDAIVLDAYNRQISIPASLVTEEFFEIAKKRLAPGGMLFVNLGTARPGSRLVRVVANTMAAGFDSPVYRCPLWRQQNVLLVASRDGMVRPPPEDTQRLVPLSFAPHFSGTETFTDDLCPVERITTQDLLLLE
ncbi:MAG: fused MFS/spermidine synthase [Planctomycetota bacterium]